MKTNRLLFATVLFFSLLFAGTVAAQNSQTSGGSAGRKAGQPTGRNYVDANHDGVCDNAGSRQGRGGQRNFIDANHDGVCDNKPANGRRGGNFSQAGCKRGAGKCGYGRQGGR
jgi:hypothetical protein